MALSKHWFLFEYFSDDHKRLVGMILDINEDGRDFQINFMHPPGAPQNFTWPSRNCTCFAKSIHPKLSQVKLAVSAIVTMSQQIEIS